MQSGSTRTADKGWRARGWALQVAGLTGSVLSARCDSRMQQQFGRSDDIAIARSRSGRRKDMIHWSSLVAALSFDTSRVHVTPRPEPFHARPHVVSHAQASSMNCIAHEHLSRELRKFSNLWIALRVRSRRVACKGRGTKCSQGPQTWRCAVAACIDASARLRCYTLAI